LDRKDRLLSKAFESDLKLAYVGSDATVSKVIVNESSTGGSKVQLEFSEIPEPIESSISSGIADLRFLLNLMVLPIDDSVFSQRSSFMVARASRKFAKDLAKFLSTFHSPGHGMCKGMTYKETVQSMKYNEQDQYMFSLYQHEPVSVK